MYGICDENIAMRETQSDDARAFDLSDLTNQIFREIFDFYFYRIFCEAITNFGRLKGVPTTHTGHSSPCGLYGHT